MLLNLKTALAQDIADGIDAAIEAGKLTAVNTAGLNVVVDNSTDPEHGDYASPVALSLAKETGIPKGAIAGTVARGSASASR